jgi:hypothetical protein
MVGSYFHRGVEQQGLHVAQVQDVRQAYRGGMTYRRPILVVIRPTTWKVHSRKYK